MSTLSERHAKFVEYLQSLSDSENRAALAALRRGAGKPPGTAPEMFPYIVPHTQGLPPSIPDLYYLIASLYALHPVNTHNGNFGTSFRQLALHRSPQEPTQESAQQKETTERSEKSQATGTPKLPESIERRFVALLRAHRDDLPVHLRHAVSLLASSPEPVPVNWAQLLEDLSHWDHPDRFVQRHWADEFWGGSSSPAAEDQAVPAAQDSGVADA